MSNRKLKITANTDKSKDFPKHLRFIILITILLVLFAFAALKTIDLGLLIFATCMTIFLYIIHSIGIDNISEFTMGKFSIKRDLRKAEKILHEIEAIKKDINKMTKLSAENSYILASESMLAMGGDRHVAERLEKNIDKLIKLVGDDESWWKDVEKLFDFRKGSQQK